MNRTEISKILNLKSNASIGAELAERQLEVITKGFNFLLQPNNNVLYIADEVGLGKTYIAIGILTLFRHYSEIKCKDLIIVPKSNLQNKWENDLRNFLEKNYKLDKVREELKGGIVLKERAGPIGSEELLTIFRMTSFSGIAMKRTTGEMLYDHLSKTTFAEEDEAKKALWKAKKELRWFNKGSERKLRNLVAYLLNMCSEPLNCVVIDEAHNYKYGPGGVDHQESIRNETTSRFLGAIEDKEIFDAFPELKKMIKFPLAKNVICLSATPKDRSLYEIKQQLSCFTNKHILTEAEDEKTILERLKSFLIRGNLGYILQGKNYSRNQCVVEHRKGNVNKKEQESPKPLEVEDSLESVFWQLIQYQSIKYLNKKNNASFEIGMLAGFETYNLDLEKRKRSGVNADESQSNKEYEQVEHRKIKESQDINVVKNIIDSFKKSFDALPPHPKQSKLISEIFEQIKVQEKSLVFSRRVATVYEIQRGLIQKFEKDLIIDTQLKYIKQNHYNSDAIRDLERYYDEKEILERLDETLKLFSSKLEIRSYFKSKGIEDKTAIDYLRHVFFHGDTELRELISSFIKKDLTNVSFNLKSGILNGLKSIEKEFLDNSSQSNEKDADSEEQTGYFFLDYFKKGHPGEKHKKKIYREDWFYINVLSLNERFRFLKFCAHKMYVPLKKETEDRSKPKESSKQEFERIHNLVISFLSTEGQLCAKKEEAKRTLPSQDPLSVTFLTILLRDVFSEEMEEWIDKRRDFKTSEFFKDLTVLQSILINIFRNGGGLLLGYIVDQSNKGFNIGMLDLLSDEDSPFLFLTEEIRTIINDFDLIVQMNFSNRDPDFIDKVMRNLTPVVGLTGQDKVNKSIVAARFRMPGYPYVLLTTDILREGEDLHLYCQNTYHYGIAWNPSDMQQRTGRIDRINSLSYRKLNDTQLLDFKNKVHVFYPYLKNSIEVNQVVHLFKNVNKFIETFNDIGKINNYETKVNLKELVLAENIPEQIQKELISKYDVKEFLIDG